MAECLDNSVVPMLYGYTPPGAMMPHEFIKLHITWPGYDNYSTSVSIRGSSEDWRPLTHREIAAKVSAAFYEYMKASTAGVLLFVRLATDGSLQIMATKEGNTQLLLSGVRPEQLYLLGLFSHDSFEWEAVVNVHNIYMCRSASGRIGAS
ncbi:uncharacterized protein FIBRA_07519 [Fibroporia radiculosa]|uniref:Uncharacterized protein n=1 Tax=Fibroporia radiculosa TaxID=599839 RepID=J4GV48_9APHY|nr:uncharacterized protein FIBRA_07519 [Fibroporia radiculosa]CCM05305.1 predicted protein [Fibroporia radiculosa]